MMDSHKIGIFTYTPRMALSVSPVPPCNPTEVEVFQNLQTPGWFVRLPLPNTDGIPWMHLFKKPIVELVIMEVWRKDDFLNFILQGRILEVVTKNGSFFAHISVEFLSVKLLQNFSTNQRLIS